MAFDGIEHVDLLAMAEADGAQLKRISPTEYAGPCPRCGGTDRFHVLTESDQNKPLWCCGHVVGGNKGCHPRFSDAADYVRIIRGRTDWADVFADLRAAGLPDNGRGGSRAVTPVTFAPKAAPVVVAGVKIADNDEDLEAMFHPPAAAWQDEATIAVMSARALIQSSDSGAAEARAYLHRRHLTPETAARFLLGFMPADAARRKGWLDAKQGAIVMPWIFNDGDIWQVKYRAVNVKKEDGQRFNQKAGASVKALPPFNGDAIAGARCVLVVEGEFDAMLGQQCAGDDVAVVTWGGTGTPPNVWALGLLANRRVVVALDADGPGAAAAEKWRELGKLATVPDGKDLGDYADLHGVEALRAWITEVTSG